MPLTCYNCILKVTHDDYGNAGCVEEDNHALTASKLNSESLVARIIKELQANPDAQTLLLRALLTNEFLGIPIRLERVEADIVELKADVAMLKG